MAQPHNPNGLLDLSKVKPASYSKLPPLLAQVKGRPAGPDQPLFAELPTIEQLKALGQAKPVDQHFYDCLSSLLGGLKSGPPQLMGLFGPGDDGDVIIRLFEPQRPTPETTPTPVYLRVHRGHAQLAISKQWVGAEAPPWLALLAAVFYGYIHDRKDFYKRKDFGGPLNAVWLLLFGRDSSRAKYEDADKDKKGKGGGKGRGRRVAMGGSPKKVDPAASRVLLKRLIGGAEAAPDLELCASVLFGEKKADGPLTRRWQRWLKNARPDNLTSKLSPQGILKLEEIRKWLRSRSDVPAEAMWRLPLFLAANGLTVLVDKDRYYPEPIREVLDRISTALDNRDRVALELHPDDDTLLPWAEKGKRIVEVIGWRDVPCPNQKPECGLYMLKVQVPKGARAGEGYGWEMRDDMPMLEARRSPLTHSVELEQILRCTRRILGGVAANAVLSKIEPVNFTIEVTDGSKIKFV